MEVAGSGSPSSLAVTFNGVFSSALGASTVQALTTALTHSPVAYNLTVPSMLHMAATHGWSSPWNFTAAVLPASVSSITVKAVVGGVKSGEGAPVQVPPPSSADNSSATTNAAATNISPTSSATSATSATNATSDTSATSSSVTNATSLGPLSTSAVEAESSSSSSMPPWVVMCLGGVGGFG